MLDEQFGYFRLPRRLSRKTRNCSSRAGERHGMCELTHGMAGERCGNGMGTARYVWIRLQLFAKSVAQVLGALKQAQCDITVILPWNSFRTTSGTKVAYSRFSTPTYVMLHNLNATNTESGEMNS
jgi:hypothetical protein